MNIFGLFFSLVVLLVSCKTEKGNLLKVSGTVKNRPAKMIYLEETPAGSLQKIVWDSSAISPDGKFSMGAKAKSESVYNLRVDMDMYPFVFFIHDGQDIVIDADFKNEKEFYRVSGSPSSQVIKDYLTVSNNMIRDIYLVRKQGDSLKKAGATDIELSPLYSAHQQKARELRDYSQQQVSNAANPTLGIFLLSTYQGVSSDPVYGLEPFNNENLGSIINQLSARFPQHAGISSIKTSLQAPPETMSPAAGWVGKPAPEISLPDTEGKKTSLSSLRGRYVLVDFWASWCRPCRAENPNVVEAYNKFRKKNFTVLGVSLDQNKEAWMKAIVTDGLNWTHISDLKQWESEVVPLYGIQGIPFNVLVDPEGKVIAENLRGAALSQKLQETLQ